MSYDFGKKKGMSPLEKKAKMTALQSANKMATDAMSGNLASFKDFKEPKDLKKSVDEMSKESGIDFKNDSDQIEDPEREGNVIGRHISDGNETFSADADTSVYDLDLELERLMKIKQNRK